MPANAPTCTYAGANLLQDSDGQFQAFLDEYLKTSETPFFARPVATTSARNASRFYVGGIGLPNLNYSDDPLKEINTLFWPTGATRWGWFFGVCNDPDLTKINQLNGGPGQLVLDDANGGTQTVYMQCIGTRQINNVDDDADNPLHLVCLVSPQYFWQNKNVGALVLSPSSSWSDAFTAIGSGIGTSISTDSIDADYLSPDDTEFSRRYECAATMLDALASSCGQRIVVGFAGGVQSQSPIGSHDPIPNNLTIDQLTQGAGGDNSATSFEMPSSILVSFPKIAMGIPYCNGDVYTISVNTGGSAGVKTIHSGCWADFTTGSFDPDNLTNLQDLANVIASDYQSWRTNSYDYTFNGIKKWTPNGWDNFILYRYGKVCQTRVASMPYNYGVDANLSQDPGVYPLSQFQLGKVKTQINRGSFGNVELYDSNNNDLSSVLGSAATVVAWDYMRHVDNYPPGTRVFLWYYCYDKRWIIVPDIHEDIITIKGNSGSDPNGKYIAPNAGCIFNGSATGVATLSTLAGFCPNNSPYSPVYDVWVVGIDFQSSLAPGPVQAKVGDRFLGRLLGNYTYSGVTKPLYAVRISEAPPASARWIKFYLYQELKNTDASQALCTVTDYFDGPNPDPTNSGITVYNMLTNLSGHYNFSGQTASVGYAVYDSKLYQYRIIVLEPTALVIEGNLTTAVTYIGGTNQATASVTGIMQGRQTATTITVYDPENMFLNAPIGAAFKAVWNDNNRQYELVNCQTKAAFIKFTLSADMSGGSATTSPLSTGDYWGNHWDILNPDPGATGLTVYDKSGMYSRALNGAKGIATYDSANDKYWIIECDQETLAYRGVCGSMTNSTTSISVGTLKAMNSSTFGQSRTASTITAYNVFGLAATGSSNAVLIQWNQTASQWEITMLAPTLITVDEDLQASDPNIQVKTQDILAWPNAAQSGWTTKITGTDCPDEG